MFKSLGFKHNDHPLQNSNPSNNTSLTHWPPILSTLVSQNAVKRQVKFYAIFVSVVCYSCSKAASCQLSINEYSILLFILSLSLLSKAVQTVTKNITH